MVLHVTTTLHRIWADVAFELFEQLGVILAHDIHQDVQSPTVRHTKHNSVHAVIGC